MKKIICVCLCIFLSSGCDKSLSHGRPVNAVVEDKAPHSLTSDTSKAPALEPKSPNASSWISWYGYAPMININNSIIKYAVNIGVYAFAIACVCYGGYRSLYRFASSEFISVGDLETVNLSALKALLEGYDCCYEINYIDCYFDYFSEDWIDERPVLNVGVPKNSAQSLLYKSNSSKLKLLLRPLKTLLRKIFKMPVHCPFVSRI
ncbi:hypothetical protein [Candidatus Endomicrobiellum agilis]|uniref:hypothetical protein n=1 Tax=Candidatus Endomicrobiellum agilis TaxID=3238957 RepID=UPI00357CC7F9|nr:hypothetical protein [Endomicrobium sp.]